MLALRPCTYPMSSRFRRARRRLHQDGHSHNRATATTTIPIDIPFTQPRVRTISSASHSLGARLVMEGRPATKKTRRDLPHPGRKCPYSTYASNL